MKAVITLTFKRQVWVENIEGYIRKQVIKQVEGCKRDRLYCSHMRLSGSTEVPFYRNFGQSQASKL